jgi:outer membrane protein OmpA-like peptidoglycan-associated protein
MTRLMIALSLLVGCASAPKPPELEAFERIKANPNVELAQKRAPELVRDSDALLAKSREEWKDKDLEESRRDALMGSIKLKTALALVEQDQSRARAQQLNAELGRVEAEYAQVAKELTATSEQIALMRKLGEARASAATEKEKLAKQLGEEQQRSAARDKITAAELAVKSADLVNAGTLAKADYSAARDYLDRAQTEMKQNAFSAAITSAEMAKQKAELAAATARPIYEKSEQGRSDKERNEQLARDAAGVPGVTVRLERRGDSQRLVLPIRGLFTKKQTIITGSESSLDAVAGLVKKYPNYTVQVVGHTDSKGKQAELVALSLARAQSVFNALVTRGVSPKQLMVSGQGGDEPVTGAKGKSGADLNNRVEVVFVY